MESYDLLVVLHLPVVVWKCVSIEYGELYVMTCLIHVLQQSSVSSWASQDMVNMMKI